MILLLVLWLRPRLAIFRCGIWAASYLILGDRLGEKHIWGMDVWVEGGERERVASSLVLAWNASGGFGTGGSREDLLEAPN